MSSPALIEQLDNAINELFADSDVAIPQVDPNLGELLSVAEELRFLPNADFRSQLRANLLESALTNPALSGSEVMASDVIVGQAYPQKKAYQAKEQILPTLFGDGIHAYAARKSNFAISALAHAAALILIITSGFWIERHHDNKVQTVMLLEAPVSDYLAIDDARKSSGGGGGGGDHDRVHASRGHLPKSSLEQFAPPEEVVRNDHPKIVAEATVIVPPQVRLPNNQMPNLGDPRSPIVGLASNGTGSGGAIGSGADLGVGSGIGGGFGVGVGGGYGGGVFHVGGGVSAPRAIYSPDPEYSSEARQAKYQGTVVLSLIVAQDGRGHDVRVARSLGMGLDEKAIEAVRQWRFEPARKDGKPVAVAVDIEVNFRLF